MKLPTAHIMSASEFCAALGRLRLGQSEFARVLKRLGDTRPERTVIRWVHAMANDQTRVSPGIACLLALMERCPEGWR